MLICPEKSRPEDNKEKQLLVYDRHVDTWVRNCQFAAHSLVVTACLLRFIARLGSDLPCKVFLA